MSLSNEEVLKGLTEQLAQIEQFIAEEGQKLDSAKAQYLKVSGAIDVLKQIEESKEEKVEEETEE